MNSGENEDCKEITLGTTDNYLILIRSEMLTGGRCEAQGGFLFVYGK